MSARPSAPLHVRAVPLGLAAILLAGGAGCAGEGAPPGAGAAGEVSGSPRAPAALPACDPDDGGLVLPDGFCALVVAGDVDRARHLAVSPEGDLFVALGGDCGGDGGIVALRDEDGDGRMDRREVVYDGKGGSGVALRDGWLYFGADDEVMRWPLAEGALAPAGERETVVRGLPAGRCHRAKSLAFDGEGGFFVNFGSASNVCEEGGGGARPRGKDPCPELEARAGVWRFADGAASATPADGERYATGLRNTVALAIRPQDGSLYGLPNGRDRLSTLWPDLYTDERSAEKPSEKLVRIRRGGDYGWPYCFHDPELGRLVLAPEYGGDGARAGRCVDKDEPLVAFPAHWAPVGLHFYAGGQFPEEYRGGAFIAFHGSWNRAPEPQDGYRVVFLPFDGDRPAAAWSTFADGFRREGQGPAEADHRPVGLAEGPDGSLYVSDDKGGTIWRIVYAGV